MIFDLDGTLIDTASEIAVALNRTFERYQQPPLSKNTVENLIGHGVHSMVERALRQVTVAGDDLMRRKPHGDMLADACNILGSSAAATLMIGDSEVDALAARNAGCRVWCVPYGYNEGRAPQTLACDRMVATVEEAARVLGNRFLRKES